MNGDYQTRGILINRSKRYIHIIHSVHSPSIIMVVCDREELLLVYPLHTHTNTKASARTIPTRHVHVHTHDLMDHTSRANNTIRLGASLYIISCHNYPRNSSVICYLCILYNYIYNVMKSVMEQNYEASSCASCCASLFLSSACRSLINVMLS